MTVWPSSSKLTSLVFFVSIMHLTFGAASFSLLPHIRDATLMRAQYFYLMLAYSGFDLHHSKVVIVTQCETVTDITLSYWSTGYVLGSIPLVTPLELANKNQSSQGSFGWINI